jgi:hypothetical protein
MVGIYSKYGSKESCTKGLLDSSKGSTPHDPESDAGGSLSSWQATQAGKVKDEGRS